MSFDLNMSLRASCFNQSVKKQNCYMQRCWNKRKLMWLCNCCKLLLESCAFILQILDKTSRTWAAPSMTSWTSEIVDVPLSSWSFWTQCFMRRHSKIYRHWTRSAKELCNASKSVTESLPMNWSAMRNNRTIYTVNVWSTYNESLIILSVTLFRNFQIVISSCQQ